jgi:DNA-binding response OmpR family regulator/predicted  nucleic acid-binding Zn-ribbon protein
VFAALIIDADADARSVIESSLSPYGLEFTVSHEPGEAMSLARTSTPDIIFLRVELPGASGFSICNKLRRNDETKYIPLIMYASDVADDVFAQHGKLKTRADEYVRLPIAGEVLLDTVRTLLPLPGQPITTPVNGSSNGQTAYAAAAAEAAADASDMEEVDLDADFGDIDFADEEPAAASAEPVVDLLDETDAAFDALTFADDDEDEFESEPASAPEPEALIDEVPLEPEPAIEAAPDVGGVEIVEPDEPRVEAPPEPAAKPIVDEVSVELEEPDAEAEPRAHESSGGNLSARREVLRLKSELNKKDRELLTFRDELEGKEREILDAKHRSRQLEAQVSEAEAKALQLEEQIISAQEQAEVASRNAETIRKREEGLKTRLEVAQKKTKDLELRLAEVDKERAGLEDKTLELASKADDLGARVEELEGELNAARESGKAAEDERDSLASALAEQKNVVVELTEQVAERDRTLAERDQTLAERNQQVAELEEKITATAEDHQSEIDFYEKRADQMRVQMQEASNTAAAEKQALTGELEARRGDILRLESELSDAQAAQQELEQRLGRRVAELEAKQGELEQQLASRADAARRATQALAVALKILD